MADGLEVGRTSRRSEPRLRAYARFADGFGGACLLAGFWGVMLLAALAHMLPRAAYLAGRPIAPDQPCGRPECDFSVFWTGGRLALSHDFTSLYTPTAFLSAAGRMLRPGSYETFFYPPTMLLPLAALAHLPFEWAAWGFLAVTLLAAWWLLRQAGYSRAVVLAGLLSPAALLNIQLLQFGILGGALLLAALRLAPRHPSAGGLGGLLAIKPQYALLLPFALLARRRWRALAWLLATVLALAGLSLAVFGPASWHAYATLGRAQTAAILAAPFDPATSQGWSASPYWLLRSLGLGPGRAFLLQAGVSALVLAVLFARPGWVGTPARVVYLSLLVTPYANTPDMVAYSLVLAQHAARRGWRFGLLDALLFLWPGLCLSVAVASGLVLTPLMVLLALWRLETLPVAAPVLPAPAQE